MTSEINGIIAQTTYPILHEQIIITLLLNKVHFLCGNLLVLVDLMEIV